MAAKRFAGSPRKAVPAKSAAKHESSFPPIAMPGQLQPETEAEIRRRAYELYEMRGRSDGLDRQDWAQAEAEVLSRLAKKESA